MYHNNCECLNVYIYYALSIYVIVLVGKKCFMNSFVE